MIEFFKPEDFGVMRDDETSWLYVSEVANKKLNDYLESCPVVYGHGVEAMKSANWCMNGPDFEVYKHTHKARLFGIEEIKKDCKHEPMGYYDLNGTKHIDAVKKESRCTFCGVELVATWSEKK